MIKTFFACLGLALAAGCAASPRPTAPAAADGTAWYFGPSSYFSPDGRIPYGGTESAVRREISGGGALIVETVTQPGHSPSMPAMVSVARMSRRGGSLVYDAADDEKTFSGTVTFSSADLSSWTYDLELARGGTVTGSGSLSGGAIRTEKLLGLERPMLVREELKAVSEREYSMRAAEMRPPRGAE